MHIFIDESGTFTRAKSGPSISVVGALVVPEYRWPRIQRKYAELRPRLGQLASEVKGRIQNEQQTADVVSLLRSNDALFWAAAIDLTTQSEAVVRSHQMAQALGITKNLTSQHHPNLHRELHELRSSLESLTPQLYVQGVVMFELIHRTLSEATLYFSQRQPKELSAFHWQIDAKGNTTVTKWEQWWRKVALPTLQSKSERDPWPQLVEGDYSFMKRFEIPVPEWIQERLPPSKRENVAWNTRLILEEDFRFTHEPTPGLELVDVLTNGVRRALIGNLQPAGFASIASLMVNSRREQCVHLLTLGKQKRNKAPYDTVILKYFDKGGRAILLPRR